MGYSGGSRKDPTYHNLGDHTETLQIDFDPTQVTYKELLEVFWKSHSPRTESGSRQYMAAVFVHNEEQKRLAGESRDRLAAAGRGKIHTQILSASRFYRAEDYHQKYRLRQVGSLLREFRAMYPDHRGFVDSTAAARVNGYVGGYGNLDGLKSEIDRYGLSEEGRNALLRIVRRT